MNNADIVQHLQGRSLEEFRSLEQERNPEMYYSGLLNFGRRLEARGELELASELYASLATPHPPLSGHPPTSLGPVAFGGAPSQGERRLVTAFAKKIPSPLAGEGAPGGAGEGAVPPPSIRKQAQQRLDAIAGVGSTGGRAEFLLERLAQESLEPTTLFGLGAASAAFRLTRVATLSRLLASPAVHLWSRGRGAQVIAGLAGFGVEAAVFPLATRAGALALGRDLDWSGAQVGRELASSIIVLGALKLVGTGSAAMLPGRKILPQAGMLGGILLGHRLEESLGLRPHLDGATTLVDSLAMLLQFNVAGSLARHAMGDPFHRWTRELHAVGAGLVSARGTDFVSNPLAFESPQRGRQGPPLQDLPSERRDRVPNVSFMAAKGEVEIRGEVNLDQFYGRGGGSDADTTKLKIDPDAVKWRPSPDEKWEAVSPDVLTKANVLGKPVIDAQGRITLRLQGIDAPELHYPASAVESLDLASQKVQDRWDNALFRQYGGLRATVAVIGALATFAPKSSPTRLRARAHAWANSPSDLFDVYGRFVSELLLGSEGESLNRWLLERGWAVPAFYDSMSEAEINDLTALAQRARNRGLGLWPDYASKIIPFDPELRLPRADDPPLKAREDRGPFLLPKLFRRQVHFEVNRRAGLLKERSLRSYLRNHPEYWIPTVDFLASEQTGQNIKASRPKRRELWEIIGPDGTVLFAPEEMIFRERPSTLLDARGKKIESL